MSSPHQQLHETIARLHDELEKVDLRDPQVRQELEQALSEIQETLQTDGQTEEDTSLVDRLSASARHYEETHPHLSGMIGSVIEALSRMGI